MVFKQDLIVQPSHRPIGNHYTSKNGKTYFLIAKCDLPLGTDFNCIQVLRHQIDLGNGQSLQIKGDAQYMAMNKVSDKTKYALKRSADGEKVKLKYYHIFTMENFRMEVGETIK